MTRSLFVYGTLRRGSEHPMARRLAAGADFAGRATVAGRIVDLGPYPGLLDPRGPGDRVAGDLYDLRDPESLLPVLDAYEGGAYERVTRPAEAEVGGRVEAWVYLYRGPLDSATMPGPE